MGKLGVNVNRPKELSSHLGVLEREHTDIVVDGDGTKREIFEDFVFIKLYKVNIL